MPEDEEAAAGAGEEGAEGPTGPTHEPFSFKLLTKVQTQQTLNGLRHNDHMRYRAYCARRLRRLYCSLKHKHGRTRFKPVAFPDDFQDMRFLEIPLVCAERAWSFGMQLKADDANAAAPNSRWRARSTQKFSKAVKHAAELEAACKIHGNQRTVMEAEAYAAYLSAVYLVEKQSWKEGLAKVIRCRKVCEYLSHASSQDEASFLKSKAQELQPLLRECKYNLGMAYDPDAPDEDDAKPSAPARKLDVSGLSYRGQGVAIPSEKIKAKLLTCLDMVGKVKTSAVDGSEDSSDVIDRYGEISSEFRDVLEDIHGDMINAGADGQTSDWRRLESYARELSVCMNVERNLVLLWGHLIKLRGLEEIGSTEARKVCKPEEGMRFCDMLKEDLEGLRELPETSETISSALAAYVTVALNCRCLFLALCYTSLGKLPEAAALFDMLTARLGEVSLPAALEDPLGRLHSVFERIEGSMSTDVAQWRCRGLALMAQKALDAAAKGAATAAAAGEGGEEGKPAPGAGQGASGPTPAGGADFAEFPPRVRDLPCKPLLCDLAYPSIEPPDFKKVLDRSGGEDGGQRGFLGRAVGGVASRFSGLWGGGGGGR